MAGYFDSTLISQIENEDSVRGYLVRRVGLLAEEATEAEKELLDEALREVLTRLGKPVGDVAP
jgi:hypothetical protein